MKKYNKDYSLKRLEIYQMSQSCQGGWVMKTCDPSNLKDSS